jgi:hypothetical protein
VTSSRFLLSSRSFVVGAKPCLSLLALDRSSGRQAHFHRLRHQRRTPMQGKRVPCAALEKHARETVDLMTHFPQSVGKSLPGSPLCLGNTFHQGGRDTLDSQCVNCPSDLSPSSHRRSVVSSVLVLVCPSLLTALPSSNRYNVPPYTQRLKGI